MNEKSCETCRCACKGRNLIGFTCWQPKEKKMRKPSFQISEEEAKTMLSFINVERFGCETIGLSSESIESSIKDLKQAGYILPDPVQEAEEMYKIWETTGMGTPYINQADLVRKQHEAIQLMKPYYEKHKGEKL